MLQCLLLGLVGPIMEVYVELMPFRLSFQMTKSTTNGLEHQSLKQVMRLLLLLLLLRSYEEYVTLWS